MYSPEQPGENTSASGPFQCWEDENTTIAKSLRDHTVYIAQKYCMPQCTSNQPNRFAYIEQAYKLYSHEHANTCPIGSTNQCLDIAGFTIWLQKRYDDYLEYKYALQDSEKETQTMREHSPVEAHNSDGLICNSPWSNHIEKKKHKTFRFRSPWKRHHHSDHGNDQLPNQVEPSEFQSIFQPLNREIEAEKTEQCPLKAVEQGMSRECCNVTPKESGNAPTLDNDLVCPATCPLPPPQNNVSFRKNSLDRNLVCPATCPLTDTSAADSVHSNKRPLDRNIACPPCVLDQQRRAPSGEVTCLMQPPSSPERNWNYSSGEERRCGASPKASKSKNVLCSATLKQQKKQRKKSPQVICSRDYTDCARYNTPSAISSVPFSPSSPDTYTGPTCFYNTQIYQDWPKPQPQSQQPSNKPSELPKGDCEVQTSDHSIALNANPDQPIYFMKIVFADELKKW